MEDHLHTHKHMLISWKLLVNGDCQPYTDVCQECLRFSPEVSIFTVDIIIHLTNEVGKKIKARFHSDGVLAGMVHLIKKVLLAVRNVHHTLASTTMFVF